MLKPIRLIGACALIVAISLVIIYWMSSDERERLHIENHLNNVAPEASKAEKYNESIDRRTIKPDRDGTDTVIKRSALPDELILGKSRSELDAFHKRQMLDISKQLSNPQTKVELPPSDDILPAMTLRDLNALHKQQTIASKSIRTVIFEPAGDGTNEAKTAVMTLDELDRMHKEQSVQARSNNQMVELPAVSPENEFQPLTLDQLDKMNSRQQLAADYNQVDDTKPIVLPPSDDGSHTMTNWGLIELHAQQEGLSKQ